MNQLEIYLKQKFYFYLQYNILDSLCNLNEFKRSPQNQFEAYQQSVYQNRVFYSYQLIIYNKYSGLRLAILQEVINQLNANFQMLKKVVQQQLLSHHCAKAKKLPKNGKLNLFGKAISIIDQIPSDQLLCQSILQLDLSHNSVHEIHTIQQFPNLQLINLSHNRILDEKQILKLQALPRLQTVYVKGNPFLRDKMSAKTISFLASIDTDVQVVSNEIASLIETLTKIYMQNELFCNYLNKIEMHMQLLSQYQMEETFINTNIPMFPKIKKIFEVIGENIFIKKSLIKAIKPELFYQQKELKKLLKGTLSQVEGKRSELIKRIYQRQELLRNLRSTYNIRVVPRRTVQRLMISAPKDNQRHQNYLSPPNLTLKQNVEKGINFNIKSVLTRMKDQNGENSPPKGYSQLLSDKSYENYQQYFMGTLIKMNPLYHLLHSPLNSLKSHEKQLLIQNLLAHLKQKMKEILRLEKKQWQYIKCKEQMNEIQNYCRQSLTEMEREVQRANQRLKKMSKICQEQADKIDTLCEQITTKDNQIQLVSKQNQKFKNQNQALKNRVISFQNSIQREDQIRQKKHQKIKEKYFKILQHKSYHLSELKNLRIINRQTQELQLKSFIFEEICLSAHIRKCERELRLYISLKNFQKIKQYGKLSKQESQNIRSLQQFLKRSRKTNSFAHLIKNIKQLGEQSKIINNIRTKNSMIKKKMIFNYIKQLREDRFEEKLKEGISEISKKLSIKKYFKSWIRFSKQLNQSIDNRINKVCLTFISNHLQTFKLHCSQRLSFNASKFALQSFLPNARIMKSYLIFSKSIQTTLSRRQMKSKKIQLIRQHWYFQNFVFHMKDRLIHKKIIVQQEMYHKKLKQSEKGKREQQKHQRRLQKIDKMRIFCNRTYYSVLIEILKRQKSQIYLQQHLYKQKKKKFYINLRTNWIANIKLRYKQNILQKSITITKNIHLFFRKLSTNNRKIQNMRSIISQSSLLKSFFRWKSFVLWSRMSSFEQKYIKLQPQIAEVGLLQRQIQKQRELLLLEIEQKNRFLADLQRKCEEYEFVINSKDAKYDKLKQIYAEALYSQEINSTVKLGKQRQLQQQLCRKYLPNRTRTSNQNIVLSSRPNANQDRTQRQERQQQSKTNRRDSFLSSFKRF